MDFKAGLYDGLGAGITGSSDLKIKIKRDADDYFYDFNDSTFKAAGWTTIAATMTEVDAVNVPGEYEYMVTVTAWDDGVYTVYFQYSGAVITPFTDAVEFRIYDGKESTAIMSTIVDGTLDVTDTLKVLLAVLGGDVNKLGDTYTFKDQGGSVKISWTVGETSTDRIIA